MGKVGSIENNASFENFLNKFFQETSEISNTPKLPTEGSFHEKVGFNQSDFLKASLNQSFSLSVPNVDLQKGSKGEQVGQLQDALTKLGYLNKEELGSGYGIFGPKTEDAVRHFQSANGLIPDGVYESRTQSVLKNVLSL